MTLLDVSRWWWDYHLLTTILLGWMLLLCWLIRQPARRIALSWATAFGLLALGLLSSLPHQEKVHLLPPAPPLPEMMRDAELTGQPITFWAPQEIPSVDLPANTDVAVSIVAVDWGLLVSIFLIGGSAVVGFWLLIGTWQIRRLRHSASDAPNDLTLSLQQLLPVGMSSPELGVVNKLPVPVACGLRRPMILLPSQLVDGEKPTQLRDVLAHELAHVRHRDLWLLALLRLLMLVLWAHPLYWLWRRRVRLDQELLADTAAAELTSRANYAEQLVALARQASESRIPRLATSVGLWETRSQLAKRVAVLLDDKIAVLRSCTHRWRIGSLLVLLGVAAGLSMVTLTPAEPPRETAQLEREEQASEHADAPALPSFESFQARAKELADQRQPNTIVGVCLDENGKPLAGVKVEVYSYQTSLRSEKESTRVAALTTNAQGEFRLANVVDIATEFPEGLDAFFSGPDTRAICVVAKLPGRVPGFQNALSYDVARQGFQCQLSMPPAHTLLGKVLTEDGKPLAGARVAVEPWNFMPSIPGGIGSTVSNADGEYALQDLREFDRAAAKANAEKMQDPHKTWSLTRVGGFESYDHPVWVEHPDFARKAVAIERIPGRLDIVLQPGGKLRGKVLAKTAGGELVPVQNAQLSLAREHPETGAPTTFETVGQKIDASGAYSFQSLPPGKYSLMAYDAEWVTSGMTGIEVTRGETSHAPDLIMTRGGLVRVQLIDDTTDKPLNREGPFKGYINAQQIPLKYGLYMGDSLTEFTAEGISTRRLAPGKYRLHVSVPVSREKPGWEDAEYLNIQNQEDLDKLPVVTVREGEVVDVVKHVAKPDPADVTATVVRVSPPADSEVMEEIKEAGDGAIFYPVPTAEESESRNGDENRGRKLDFVPITPPVESETTGTSDDQSTARPPKLLYLAWLDKNAPSDDWGDITLWDPHGNVLTADEQAEFLDIAGEPMDYNNEQGILPPLAMFFEIDPTVPTAVTPRAVADGIEIRHYSSRNRPEGVINVALLSGADPRLKQWPEQLRFTARYVPRQSELFKTISASETLPVQIAGGVSWYVSSDWAREYQPEAHRMVRAEGKTAGVLQIRADLDQALTQYSAKLFLKNQSQPVDEAFVTVIEPEGVMHTIRVTDAIESNAEIDRVEFWQHYYADLDLGTVPLLLRLLPEE